MLNLNSWIIISDWPSLMIGRSGIAIALKEGMLTGLLPQQNHGNV